MHARNLVGFVHALQVGQQSETEPLQARAKAPCMPGRYLTSAGLGHIWQMSTYVKTQFLILHLVLNDMDIVTREYWSAANSPLPYFIGRSLVLTLFSVTQLAGPLLTYHITGLSSNVKAMQGFVLIEVRPSGRTLQSLHERPVVASGRRRTRRFHGWLMTIGVPTT